MNALVEQYLRLYTNHRQSDWVEWLLIAEFAHNQNVSRGTGHSPFVLNYGHNPSIDIKANRRVNNDSVEKFVDGMKTFRKTAQLSLKHAKDDIKKYYDWKAQSPIEYIKGNKVLLEATNIQTERPSKSFDDKCYGPFEILEKVGPAAYKLKLDHSWHGIHPVFNECLLHPYKQGQFPSQWQPPPSPPDIVQGEQEQEIENIVDAREKCGSIVFLVHWKGFPREQNEWKKEWNLENAKDSIRNFYCLHLSAPRLTKTVWLRSSDSDPPRTCSICTKQLSPVPSKGSILLSSDFIRDREVFRRLPNHLFEIAPVEDNSP